jgi:hypothetical protein
MLGQRSERDFTARRDDHCTEALAGSRVGQANNGGICDGRMAVQRLLDF